MLENFDAIIFDLDDTLIETRFADELAYCAVEDNLIKKFKLTLAEARRTVEAFRSAMSLRPYDVERASHVWTWRRYLWTEALQSSLVKQFDSIDFMSHSATDTFRDVRLRHCALSEECSAALMKLRDRGVKLGIVTNGHEIVQREKLAACCAYAIFKPEHVIVGGEQELARRRQKPDVTIFHRACDVLNVQPSRAIFVGDDWDVDVVGAVAAGMGKVFYVIGSKCEECHRQSVLLHDRVQVVKSVCEMLETILNSEKFAS